MRPKKNNVVSTFTVVGFGFNGSGQNSGITFTTLKDWSERKGTKNKVPAIINRATKAFANIKDGLVFPFNLPAIIELGTASGFDFELIDRGGIGHEKLTEARNKLLDMVADYPNTLVRVRPNGLEDAPEFKLNIDQEKAETLGAEISDINDTIAIALGSSYVNNFIDRGRVKKYMSKLMHLIGCCQKILTIGMCEDKRDKWFLFRDLVLATGNSVRHVWSVTTVYLL